MPVLRKVALFTNEYPPHVYGGAGVHVEYLSRELARLVPVEVRCFGDQEDERGQPHSPWLPGVGGSRDATPTRGLSAPSTLSPARSRWRRTRSMPTSSTATPGTPTWAACWQAALGRALVLTTHSLEPLRPWKVEQLGNAYHLSSWMERTAIEKADAVIAVSQRDPRRRAAPLRRRARAGPRHPQRHRPGPVPPDRGPGRARALRRRPEPALRALRRPHHPPEGHHPPGQRDPDDRPRPAGRALRRRPDTPEIGREMEEADGRGQRRARRA